MAAPISYSSGNLNTKAKAQRENLRAWYKKESTSSTCEPSKSGTCGFPFSCFGVEPFYGYFVLYKLRFSDIALAPRGEPDAEQEDEDPQRARPFERADGRAKPAKLLDQNRGDKLPREDERQRGGQAEARDGESNCPHDEQA